MFVVLMVIDVLLWAGPMGRAAAGKPLAPTASMLPGGSTLEAMTA
jgi:hypothetical protein